MSMRAHPNTLVFIQSRANLNTDTIEEYAQMMLDGVEFDPVSAIREGDEIYVWDGQHRGEAAKSVRYLLAVDVRPGTRDEAEWLALAANQKHGLRRSREDKRRAVRKALEHPNGAMLSDREIARHCGVSHPMVGAIREELEATGKITSQDTRTGADGREINTAKIGTAQPTHAEIWQIEHAVSAWLDGLSDHPANEPETILEAIKAKSDSGRSYLNDIEAHLKSEAIEYRKRDLRQACNNLLEQLRQAERGDWIPPSPTARPAPTVASTNAALDEMAGRGSADSDRGEYLEVNLVGNLVGPPPEPDQNLSESGAQPERGEFDCPRCGREKIVRTNGGAWCLNEACGKKWQTVTEFKDDLYLADNPALERQQMQIHVMNRFRGIFKQASIPQLREIDAWLDDLEREMTQRRERPDDPDRV